MVHVFFHGRHFFDFNQPHYLNCVDSVWVAHVVDERTVPLAAKSFERQSFAYSLSAEKDRSKLIITTGIKDSSNGGGQPVHSNFADKRRVLRAEKIDKQTFGAGRAVPFGQIVKEVFDFVEGTLLCVICR